MAKEKRQTKVSDGKDFLNEDDVRESKKMAKSDGGKYIRLDNGKTPFMLVESRYGDGIVHWLKLPNGDNKKVVCLGDHTQNQGYNPEICPICKILSDQGQEWRRLASSGRMKTSAELKETNKRMSGKYEMALLIAKGEMVYTGGTGKARKMKPDMSDATVGILTLNATQKKTLEGLIGSPQYPWMQNKKDLFNRVILANKHDIPSSWDASRTMTVVDFIPAKRPSALPELDYDGEELDVTQEFVPDAEDTTNVAMMYLGKFEDDGEVDYEDDDLSEDDFGEEDDDFGDDEEDDFSEDSEEGFEDDDFEIEESEDDDFEFSDSDEDDADVGSDEEDESGFDEEFLSDVDDAFEDDDPWEEEAPAIPKTPVKKKSQTSKSKPSTGTSTSQSKRSGTVKSTPKAISKRGTSASSGRKSSIGAPASSVSSKKSPKGTRTAKRGTSTGSSVKKSPVKKKGAPKKADF